MPKDIIADVASLCWVNPFGAQRGEIEQRLLGEAFKPLGKTGGRESLSPNLPPLLELCKESLPNHEQHPNYHAHRRGRSDGRTLQRR